MKQPCYLPTKTQNSAAAGCVWNIWADVKLLSLYTVSRCRGAVHDWQTLPNEDIVSSWWYGIWLTRPANHFLSLGMASGQAKNSISTRLSRIFSNFIYTVFFNGHGKRRRYFFFILGTLWICFCSWSCVFGTSLRPSFCSWSQLLELYLKGCILPHGDLPCMTHLV